MPILQDASIQDRKRLLELFPVAVLKEAWPGIKGTKEEICYAVAAQTTPKQVITFIRAQLCRCKQHCYVFNREENAAIKMPNAIDGGEKVYSSQNEALYVVRTSYSVVLKDPLEETDLDFLWPVKIQLRPKQIIVRFVALEKDVSSYFDRQCYVVRRTIDEKKILQELNLWSTERTDLHKGIKGLWDTGFMDSPRTRFKKPMSVASEAMDEELGILEHNPQLYEVLVDSTLLNTLFVINKDQNCGVSTFSADCTNGFLAFPSYSDAERNTDFVIDEVLEHNQ